MEIVINDAGPVGGSLDVEYEKIEVTSLTKPDLNWEFVDSNGHFHAYSADGKLPTLVRRLERIEYDEPDEDGETGYTIEHLHCAICDEEIRLGTMVKTWREFAPGRMSWTVRVNGTGTRGEKRTVRIIHGDQMHFGVGVIGEVFGDHGQPAIEIYGIGELGARKAPATVGG